MRLGTLKEEDSRDGVLVVISKCHSKCVTVTDIAYTLQEAMDDWDEVRPQLQEVCDKLCAGELDAEAMDFDETMMHSPLPRAFQWADGSAYVNHVELVRKARGAENAGKFLDGSAHVSGWFR